MSGKHDDVHEKNAERSPLPHTYIITFFIQATCQDEFGPKCEVENELAFLRDLRN